MRLSLLLCGTLALTGGATGIPVTDPDSRPLGVESVVGAVGPVHGGSEVTVRGEGFTPGTRVYFGDRPAAEVRVENQHALIAVAPPGAEGTAELRIVRGDRDQTVAAEPFLYLPAASRTFVSHDFEDGTVGGFQTFARSGGTVEAGEWGPGLSVSGRGSVRTRIPAGVEGAARLVHFFREGQPANDAPGVYQRWYIRFDRNTLDAVRQGQIKLLLNRGEANPPSWLHVGIGGQFPGGGDQIKVLLDYNTGVLPNGGSATGARTVPDRWMELQTWYQRAGGVGRARMWIDGRLVVDHADARFGTDDSTNVMRWFLGIAYTQSTRPGGDLTVWVDDAIAADGFIPSVR